VIQYLQGGIILNKKNLINTRIGRLTIIDQEIRISSGKKRIWVKCECDCGNIVWRRTDYLLGYDNKLESSCGCSLKKYKYKNRILFAVWLAMKRRCNTANENSYDYRAYKGRGISVCKEWEDFDVFYEWSINNGYAKGLQIDRKNNDGNYEPSNCRWITRQENMNNTRRNVIFTANGETGTIRYFSTKYNINYKTIRSRLDKGMSMEGAISTPARTFTRRNKGLEEAMSK
jgi:hypothetical protein